MGKETSPPEVDVEINQITEPEEELLGGPSDLDHHSSGRRFRWWDELADSDTDSCYDCNGSSSTYYKSQDSDEDHEVPEKEKDLLPGPVTRKRKRDDEDEDNQEGEKIQTLSVTVYCITKRSLLSCVLTVQCLYSQCLLKVFTKYLRNPLHYIFVIY